MTATAALPTSGVPSGRQGTPLMIRNPPGKLLLPLPPVAWCPFNTATFTNRPEEPAVPLSAATLTAERPCVPVRFRSETLAKRPTVPPVPFNAATLTAERPLLPRPLSMATFTTRPARPADALAIATLATDRAPLLLVPAWPASDPAVPTTVPARPMP